MENIEQDNSICYNAGKKFAHLNRKAKQKLKSVPKVAKDLWQNESGGIDDFDVNDIFAGAFCGFLGYNIGFAIGGDTGKIIGSVAGVLAPLIIDAMNNNDNEQPSSGNNEPSVHDMV